MIRWIACAAAVSLLALAGCRTTPAAPPARFVLDPQPAIKPAPLAEGTLAIRSLDAADPYEKRIVIRKPGLQIAFSNVGEWAEKPRDSAVRAITDGLLESRRFADIGPATSVTVPDYLLGGELRRFDLDQTQETWRAVCEVRIEVRAYRESRLLWAGTLLETEPLSRNDLSALSPAMSAALSRVVERAVAEISAAR